MMEEWVLEKGKDEILEIWNDGMMG